MATILKKSQITPWVIDYWQLYYSAITDRHNNPIFIG